MEPAAEDKGRAVRALVRAAVTATLATTLAEDGWPYASLVACACDHSGRPLLLLSDLAVHSRNLAADDRASLLCDGTRGLEAPLAGARATLLGRVRPLADEALLARFLARHRDAADLAGFADFRLYRMEVERAHLVAGFGRIDWLGVETLVYDTCESAALAEAEASILAHMNADHAEAVGLCAERLLGAAPGPWAMTGIDPEGIDLRHGAEALRLGFERPVSDAAQARAALAALARKARATEAAAR